MERRLEPGQEQHTARSNQNEKPIATKPLRTGRGKPFAKGTSGNAHGRPIGSRNKATLIAQSLLYDAFEPIVKKTIERALAGDPSALKLCFDRLVPRERAIEIDLPIIKTATECADATASVIVAVSKGQLLPTEGQTLVALIQAQRQGQDMAIIEERLARLEAAVKKEP